MSENNAIQTWNKVLSGAMKIPGVKVNRDSFLTDILSKYVDNETIEKVLGQKKSTVGVIPDDILDILADECIAYHTKIATGTSTLMGMPGGWTMLGTVPGDILQYYFHVFSVSQKLAYIYGYPDLCDDEGDFTEDAYNMLTIFVGVMGGTALAQKALQEVAEQFQKQLILRLPKMPLTKGVVYPMVKNVAKWIGVNLTKKSFAQTVSKIVPIVGGVVSGVLTWATFRPQAKRLKKSLKAKMLLAQKIKASQQSQA